MTHINILSCWCGSCGWATSRPTTSGVFVLAKAVQGILGIERCLDWMSVALHQQPYNVLVYLSCHFGFFFPHIALEPFFEFVVDGLCYTSHPCLYLVQQQPNTSSDFWYMYNNNLLISSASILCSWILLPHKFKHPQSHCMTSSLMSQSQLQPQPHPSALSSIMNLPSPPFPSFHFGFQSCPGPRVPWYPTIGTPLCILFSVAIPLWIVPLSVFSFQVANTCTLHGSALHQTLSVA